MNCRIQGCTGQYERRAIIHTVQRDGNVIVFEDVPADVCDVCSDVLLAPETIEHLEAMMDHGVEPTKHAPVYSYT